MRIFMITRNGNSVQGQVHTMMIAAQSAEDAESIARAWRSPNKEGFSDSKLTVTEIELNKPQIVFIQSL